MCFVLVNGVFMFSLGCFLATRRYRFQTCPTKALLIEKDTVLAIMFWIALLGLPIFIINVHRLAAHGPTGILLLDLRLALTSGKDIGFGPAFYLVPVAFSSAALHGLLEYHSCASKSRFVVSVLVAATYSVFMTGRTFIFLLVLLITGVFLISRRLRVAQLAPWSLGVMLIAFISIAVVMQKGGNSRAPLRENLATLSNNFRVYLLGALPACDALMKAPPAPTWGSNTFRTVLKITNKIGYDTPPPPLIQKYVRVPMPMNVYTVYQTYLMDFSYWGVLTIQFVLGIWHGYLYRRACQAKPLFVCLYALFLYPLAMQFFQDEYTNFLIICVMLTIGTYFLTHRNLMVRAARTRELERAETQLTIAFRFEH